MSEVSRNEIIIWLLIGSDYKLFCIKSVFNVLIANALDQELCNDDISPENNINHNISTFQKQIQYNGNDTVFLMPRIIHIELCFIISSGNNPWTLLLLFGWNEDLVRKAFRWRFLIDLILIHRCYLPLRESVNNRYSHQRETTTKMNQTATPNEESGTKNQIIEEWKRDPLSWKFQKQLSFQPIR